ncbi:MAG: hypothetical protein ACI4J1_11200 [Ruminiclostridium sp.]
MAVIFCLNLAACSDPPIWRGKWEITDENYSNMKIAEVMSNKKTEQNMYLFLPKI